MAKTPVALLLLGTLACPAALFASPARSVSAPIAVSVSVVRSCGVEQQASGRVGVRCTRGGADRVVVSSDEPRLVTLAREGSTMSAVIEAEGEERRGGERFVTLQF